MTYAFEVSFRPSLSSACIKLLPKMMITKQLGRDKKITGLVQTMTNLYDFIQDTNPLEKIRSYQRTVERLVQQTKECAYFIADYSKTSFFGAHPPVPRSTSV